MNRTSRSPDVRPLLVVLLFALELPAFEPPAPPDPALLTIDRLFKDGEFQGSHYGGTWLEGESVHERVEASGGPDGGQDIVRYDPESGAREVVVPSSRLIPRGELRPLSIEGHEWSRDRSKLLVYTNSRQVWRQNTRGDYWVLDVTAHELRRVAPDAPPSTLMFAKLSPEGTRVAYVRDHDLHVEDLRSGDRVALTTDGSADVINGTFDWVYEEELSLRDGFRWSPDGARIAYWQLDTSGVPEFTIAHNTGGLYPRLETFRYPKAGETNSACRVGVVRSTGGETVWMSVPGDPRDHYLARMDWAESSDELLIQQLNRLQNTVRLYLADAGTGEVRLLLEEKDPAWVDIHDELFWLRGGQEFTWISERDGWRHLYVGERATGTLRCVTPGGFDVIELLAVDAGESWAYFVASPENAAQRYLYRARIEPGETAVERVTPAEAPGTHDYRISPDGRWAIHRHSTFDTPPVSDLVRLPSHERVRSLEDNSELRGKLEKLRRCRTELFSIVTDEGVEIDAWCILPPDLDLAKKHPVLVYVYGEPAGQTVLDRWGGPGHLWHVLLAQRGYVVMSFDNRGTSSPKGREWRKCVYRKIGILGPRDQAKALEAALRERPYLDATRVAIWGWSGGGSSSLNAIFRYPELYGTAMAVAPVPNQRHYDTIYQERYMGLPATNAEGFEKGSPVNHAHRLVGNLLVVHGTGDDNCHYQGVEALVNELIRHDKAFTMMAYPGRRHGIWEGANTSLHLRRLLTRYLEEHVPPGPREPAPAVGR